MAAIRANTFFLVVTALAVLSATKVYAQTTDQVTTQPSASATSVSAPPATPTAGTSVATAKQVHRVPRVRRPQTSVGVFYMSWEENIQVAESGITDKGVAENSGQGIIVEHEVFISNWGYSYGAGLASGFTRRGGDGTTTYPKSTAYWNGGLITGKVFGVINPRMLVGVGVPLIFRTIDWPTASGRYQVTTGPQMQYGLTAELQLRLALHWDLVQVIGQTFPDAPGVLWRIGANYIF